MKTPTDEQLKQTLVKMLPEVVYIIECMPICGPDTPNAELIDGSWRYHSGIWTLYWNHYTANTTDEVLDTELLHLCWLVETALDYNKELNNYAQWLDRMVNPEGGIGEYMFRATWQQRVIALAKVKGIDIV